MHLCVRSALAHLGNSVLEQVVQLVIQNMLLNAGLTARLMSGGTVSIMYVINATRNVLSALGH
jgi:hypothetical protein